MSLHKKSYYPPGNHHVSHASAQVIIKVSGHQHRWLAGGYDLEMGLIEVDCMVVSWWIVAFLPSGTRQVNVCEEDVKGSVGLLKRIATQTKVQQKQITYGVQH